MEISSKFKDTFVRDNLLCTNKIIFLILSEFKFSTYFPFYSIKKWEKRKNNNQRLVFLMPHTSQRDIYSLRQELGYQIQKYDST